MTTFFHVDRSNQLLPGQTVGLTTIQLPVGREEHYEMLFPSGVSRHGFYYTGLRANEPDPGMELLWEFVRRAAFAERPSRLTSMFAWPSLAEAESFKRERGLRDARIFEVEADTNAAFIANMHLLNSSGPLLLTSELAHAYWAGEAGPTTVNLRPPRWEVLIPLPAVIGVEVRNNSTVTQNDGSL
ncbi:DUF2441 domain-containing protein [Caballeronia novacaledonica]|uniref:DUF2441 domain-containing protein n=1 Tax=Caballeronia novacaledonica TaxID=1544861 RepID=A0ACB5QJ50_9BURK|nr:DUF2441 domain-containing protein [Caballeronia novacaledonica]